MFNTKALTHKALIYINKIKTALHTLSKKSKLMETGKVKFFNEAKGYGFITSNNGKDVFVHANDISGTIRENDNVQFEVEQGRKGPQAVNVSLA